MAYTAPTSPSVGDDATASWADIAAADIIALANPAIFSGSSSVNQSIANNVAAWTALTMDTEQYDTANGHSIVTNTSRYTVQSGWAGYYLVVARACYGANATGRRGAAVGVNGTVQPLGQCLVGAATASGGITPVSTFLSPFMNVGDYFEAMCYQDSTIALSTVIGQSGLTVQWLHA